MGEIGEVWNLTLKMIFIFHIYEKKNHLDTSNSDLWLFSRRKSQMCHVIMTQICRVEWSCHPSPAVEKWEHLGQVMSGFDPNTTLKITTNLTTTFSAWNAAKLHKRHIVRFFHVFYPRAVFSQRFHSFRRYEESNYDDHMSENLLRSHQLKMEQN